MGSGIAQGFNFVETCRGDDGDGGDDEIKGVKASSSSSPTVTGGSRFTRLQRKGYGAAR